jgi:cytochrome c-type biogenesis protein CcmH
MSRRPIAVLIATLLLAASSAWADPPGDPASEHHDEKTPIQTLGYVEGAQALESRLMAPCCWQQTLDIHGSEIAQELKKEIRSRLAAGESAEAIEASIVARHGEKVRAVPKGSPLGKTASLLLISMVVAGVGAGYLLVRWRRRSAAAAILEREAEGPTDDAARDRYDQEIDAELERM